LPLDEGDLGLLVAVGSMQWAEIDPSIFGTLFERFLDPAKRAQIGAHYTDAKKILQIVDPVVMRPLEAEWAEVKERIEKLVSLAQEKGPRAKEWAKAEEERGRFVERLASLRILDPACGSGNFLYMALQRVKDLEFRVNNECEKLGLKALAPRAGPEILHGIEINRLAAEIARTTIWIGDIQWGLRHALYTRPEPVLRKLDQIECRDAVLQQRPDASFVEAQWPEVDFIVGNPPFLGGKAMRQGRRPKSGEISGLGDEYVDALFTVYKGRVPAEADFVCYWFSKAWEAMQARRVSRAGLVATNSIRGAPTGACSTLFRRNKEFSTPGATSLGLSRAPPSGSRWCASELCGEVSRRKCSAMRLRRFDRRHWRHHPSKAARGKRRSRLRGRHQGRRLRCAGQAGTWVA
jgi:type II restriction/modification system DNA methylase subunit YeeA